MSNNKFVLIADSTQLQAFFECPEMWNLAHQEHLEKLDSHKEAMNMGSYGHVMLENYYKQKAIGKTQLEALDFAVSIEPDPRLELEKPQIDLLRDKIKLYTYTYSRNDFVPESPDSVELGFSVKVYEDDQRLFILEGKLDHYQAPPMGGFFNGTKSIMDHKFQMRHHQLYNKRLQFRNYAYATGSNLFVVNYISMTKKTDESTFRRVSIPFSTLEHQLWEKRLIGMFREMEVKIKMANGEFDGIKKPFEHRWNSCENKYGWPCQYTDICEQTSPLLVDIVKQTKYKVIPKWHPW